MTRMVLIDKTVLTLLVSDMVWIIAGTKTINQAVDDAISSLRLGSNLSDGHPPVEWTKTGGFT